MNYSVRFLSSFFPCQSARPELFFSNITNDAVVNVVVVPVAEVAAPSPLVHKVDERVDIRATRATSKYIHIIPSFPLSKCPFFCPSLSFILFAHFLILNHSLSFFHPSIRHPFFYVPLLLPKSILPSFLPPSLLFPLFFLPSFLPPSFSPNFLPSQLPHFSFPP